MSFFLPQWRPPAFQGIKGFHIVPAHFINYSKNENMFNALESLGLILLIGLVLYGINALHKDYRSWRETR